MNTFKVILIMLLSLIIINLGFLNWKIFVNNKNNIISPNSFKSPSSVKITLNKEKEETCSLSCQNMIKEATKSSLADNDVLIPQVVLQEKKKDIYIPLGIGSVTSSTWIDLKGIEASINSDEYKGVKEINFEGALRIPTNNGKVFARLYNVTDNHPVWFSDISGEGKSGALARSGNINFDNGIKIYRVQMYSTLGFEAFLDNARIRISYL